MDDSEFAKELLLSDFDGVYTKHGEMWETYDRALKFLTGIIGLPFIAGGALLSAEAIRPEHLSSLSSLPSYIFGVMLLSGLLGFAWLQVLINLRMNVLLYARSINAYRGLLRSIADDDIIAELDILPLPFSPNVPNLFESFRHTGIVVLVASAVNAIYVSLSLSRLSPLATCWAISAGIILFLIQYLLYWLQGRRKLIAGHGKNE